MKPVPDLRTQFSNTEVCNFLGLGGEDPSKTCVSDGDCQPNTQEAKHTYFYGAWCSRRIRTHYACLDVLGMAPGIPYSCPTPPLPPSPASPQLSGTPEVSHGYPDLMHRHDDMFLRRRVYHTLFAWVTGTEHQSYASDAGPRSTTQYRKLDLVRVYPMSVPCMPWLSLQFKRVP